MKMKNETAIITGSTSGIGKAIANWFLREGCKVAICSRTEERVDKTLSEFKEKFGDSVFGMICDVTDPIALKLLVESTIKKFGSVRILVANAGVNLIYGPFQFIDPEKINNIFKKTLGVNLIGMINSIAAVLPQMVEQNYGRIITLSGGGAERPLENMILYSASKGGVISFSKCMALELKTMALDIKLNIFSPGMIDTNLGINQELLEEWKDKETFDKEMALIKKYVMTDIDKSTKHVLPYALPSCKKNGKVFRGFSTLKTIRGFIKVSKEMKSLELER
jgi:NAD(P)-dependent dehydrogenase (short-subunit alcohol dehydrogenase family)